MIPSWWIAMGRGRRVIGSVNNEGFYGKTMWERSAKSSLTPSLGVGGCRQEGGGVYNRWPVEGEWPCSTTNLLPLSFTWKHAASVSAEKNTQKWSWDVFTVATRGRGAQTCDRLGRQQQFFLSFFVNRTVSEWWSTLSSGRRAVFSYQIMQNHTETQSWC